MEDGEVFGSDGDASAREEVGEVVEGDHVTLRRIRENKDVFARGGGRHLGNMLEKMRIYTGSFSFVAIRSLTKLLWVTTFKMCEMEVFLVDCYSRLTI